MMKLKAVYGLAAVGILLALLSAFLYASNCDWSNAIGVVSTVISIILGLVSIIYTYISGKETMNTLCEIRKQNSRLVDKINYELSKNNFNNNNIDYIRKTIKDE